MSRPSPTLFRALEPLVQALWPLFFVSSIVTAVLWWIADSWVEKIADPGLRAALSFLASSADAIWLLLAAINVYLPLAEREGIARARTLAAITFLASAATAWSSVATGFPLGAVVYTSHLGARVGPVPIGWPLLWFVIVAGGRSLIFSIRPRISHLAASGGVGLLALLTDLNLEPIAAKLRLYWFWYVSGTNTPSAAPARNYATWFIVGVALAWFAREKKVGIRSGDAHSTSAFIVVNAMLCLGHLRLFLDR